jgi:GNAT superfamily N-acetyltransferase
MSATDLSNTGLSHTGLSQTGMSHTGSLSATSTLTDRAVVAMADRVVHVARTADRPFLAAEDLVATWIGERGIFTNVAYVLREPDDWDRVLARVTEVVPPGRPLSLISPWSVPDLGSGWTPFGHPPLMVRAVAEVTPDTPAELTVTEVVDQPGLEVLERTLVDGYPDPTLQPYRWGEVHDARVLGGPTHFFLGSVAGRPVATAAGHVAAGVVAIELVATMADARGRGYGEAVTWAATLVDPTRPAVLIASDLGRPVYERMGYVAVSRWTFWHRPA